jgi:hypothetical protein
MSFVSIPPENQPVKQRIEALGDRFQNINLAGEWTAPNHFLGDYPNIKWRRLKDIIPQDLRGCTVLEIGCAERHGFEYYRHAVSLRCPRYADR